MMKYYIAYGSNLSVEQMAYRCPDATIVGTSVLEGWRLVFRKHATIEPCYGFSVPVLVWAISKRDEERLDRYEGYPRYYYKEILPVDVHTESGQINLEGMVYLMTDGNIIIPPSGNYFRIIAEGYKRFGFNLVTLHDALEESFYNEGFMEY